MRLKFLAILVTSTTLIAATAPAALLEADLVPGSGDVLLTVDTDTQLEWLDVTETVGQSYLEVLASEYVTTLGFRFAFASEIETLWLNAGAGGAFFNNTGVNIFPANYEAAVLLVDLMGCTSQFVGEPCDGLQQNWHIAMYGLPPVSPELVAAALVDYFGPPDVRAGGAAMWLDFGPTVDLLSRPDVGSYLVRPIPEPDTYLLFALGLTALALGRHNYRRSRGQYAASLDAPTGSS